MNCDRGQMLALAGCSAPLITFCERDRASNFADSNQKLLQGGSWIVFVAPKKSKRVGVLTGRLHGETCSPQERFRSSGLDSIAAGRGQFLLNEARQRAGGFLACF
jgi:hypothetical protein